jgi:hypothetical protein
MSYSVRCTLFYSFLLKPNFRHFSPNLSYPLMLFLTAFPHPSEVFYRSIRTNLSSSCMINLITVISTSHRAVKGIIPRCFAVIWLGFSPAQCPPLLASTVETKRKRNCSRKSCRQFLREVTNVDVYLNFKLVSNI